MFECVKQMRRDAAAGWTDPSNGMRAKIRAEDQDPEQDQDRHQEDQVPVGPDSCVLVCSSTWGPCEPRQTKMIDIHNRN